MMPRLTQMKALFPNKQMLFDRTHLEAIAARLFRQTADYIGTQNTGHNRRRIFATLESLLQDQDALHAVTFQPMLLHRHVKPELARLLQLHSEISVAISTGNASDDLQQRVKDVARDSNLASAGADAPEHAMRTARDIAMIKVANEMKRRSPRLKTTDIARRITSDPTLNPPDSDLHIAESAVYKLLLLCEIR
jgi:hypothetical protein